MTITKTLDNDDYKHARNELYNMLHRQERMLAENEYDLIKAIKRVEDIESDRKSIERGIESTKRLIVIVESQIEGGSNR